MPSSEAVTVGIRVRVLSEYDDERSEPADGRWFFVYTVRITNESEQTVRLQSRHWIITDAEGRVEHVRGPGVVGRQPILPPGESFEYSSACPLGTSFGTMQGTYQMIDSTGERFEVEIAPFALSEPLSIN